MAKQSTNKPTLKVTLKRKPTLRVTLKKIPKVNYNKVA